MGEHYWPYTITFPRPASAVDVEELLRQASEETGCGFGYVESTTRNVIIQPTPIHVRGSQHPNRLDGMILDLRTDPVYAGSFRVLPDTEKSGHYRTMVVGEDDTGEKMEDAHMRFMRGVVNSIDRCFKPEKVTVE